jgi:plasmid stabilization system protein ParE
VRGVVFLEWAEEEIEEAADYLDEEAPGLGDEFFAEVQRTIGRLRLNPYVGPKIEARVHRIALRRFSYDLIYVIPPSSVLVVAVVHHRRDPGYWRNRL